MEKSADKQEVIEVKDILARFSTDIIASCAFGIECNCLKDSNAEFRQWGRKIFETTLASRVARLITLLFPAILKLVRISIISKELSFYFRKMVRDTIEYRENNNVHRNDFMQLMIQLKNKTLGAVEDDPLLKMPSEESHGLKSNEPFGKFFFIDI